MSTLKNHIAHFWAFNNSSVENSRTTLYYLVFMFYLLLVIVSTTDAMILMPAATIKLPILSVPLPLWEFYLFIPLLVVILHFNLLYNFIQHSKKIHAYQKTENDANNLTVYPLLVNFIIAGKSTGSHLFLRFVMWLLVFAFPLSLLCLIQWQFSAYHSVSMTFWHFITVMLDASLLVFTWHKIFNPPLATEVPAQPDDSADTTAVVKQNGIKGIFKGMKLSWQVAVFVVFALFNLIVLLIFKNSDGQSVRYLMPHLKVNNQTLIEAKPSDQIIQRFIALGKSKEEAYCEYARGIDLSGRDLRFCNFSGAYLVNANLKKADLRGADFSATDLHGSNLTKANVQHAIFHYTKMHYAKVENIDLRKSSHKGIDFRNAWLTNIDLNNLNLSTYLFSGAMLEKVDLKNADLTGVQFTGAVFSECFMKGAKLTGAILNGVTFKQKNSLQGANLIGAQLKGAGLSGVSLSGADLSNAALEGSVWRNDSLQGANLRNASLQGAVIDIKVFSANCLAQVKIRGTEVKNLKGQNNYYYSIDPLQPPYWKTLERVLKKYNASGHVDTHKEDVKEIIEERLALAKERLTRQDTTAIQEYLGTNNGDNFVQARKNIACQNIYIAEGILLQNPVKDNAENERVRQGLSDYLRNNCARIYEKIVSRGKVQVN